MKNECHSRRKLQMSGKKSDAIDKCLQSFIRNSTEFICNVNKFFFLVPVVGEICYQEFDLFLLVLLATDSVSATKEASKYFFQYFWVVTRVWLQ